MDDKIKLFKKLIKKQKDDVDEDEKLTIVMYPNDSFTHSLIHLTKHVYNSFTLFYFIFSKKQKNK